MLRTQLEDRRTNASVLADSKTIIIEATVVHSQLNWTVRLLCKNAHAKPPPTNPEPWSENPRPPEKAIQRRTEDLPKHGHINTTNWEDQVTYHPLLLLYYLSKMTSSVR